MRFWPMILNHAFATNDASTLLRDFPSSTAYLQIILTTYDPFSSPVSPTLMEGSGLIRRRWASGHRLHLIAYFGPNAPKKVIGQADWIGNRSTVTKPGP
ncbi:MAG TPA: hypothetical protein VGL60_06910 [Acidimicrobiales bacterium]